MKLISQPTRKAARLAVKTLKQAGKVANLIDKGGDLEGNNRWFVEVIEGGLKGTLKSPVKPCGKDPRVVVRLVKAFNKTAYKPSQDVVQVFIKPRKLKEPSSLLFGD